MEFNKNKPQNVRFKSQASGSEIEVENDSVGSENREDFELNHSRSNKGNLEPTLGFHSTLIGNDYEVDLIKQPQEESYDLYDMSKIEKNWKKIHWSVWKKKVEDPNLFFYYFHNFSEILNVTPFTQEEEEILLITLVQLCASTTSVEKAKNRAKGKWGFLSLKIPNRNGLICYQNYLKIRLRRGEFKNDELFLDYLKKKIANEEVLEKIQDSNFLDFFMNLDPGYSNSAEQADFWMKEALRNINAADAQSKIGEIDKYIESKTMNNDYCFVPNKELQKKNFELLLVSISNHPYVKIQNNKRTPSYSITKSARSKETRDTSSKKDEGKFSTTSKNVTNRKQGRLRIEENETEGLVTPDRVDRSTDISNPQDHHGLLIENEGGKDDDAKITPEPSASGKVYRNLKKTGKKNETVPIKTDKDKKLALLELQKKHKLEFRNKDDVESYDSEPDLNLNKKGHKELPCFFSDISSITSDDENKQSDFVTDGFSVLGLNKKKDTYKPVEAISGKRKAFQAGLEDRAEKKRKTSRSKKGFFEEEIPKTRKKRTSKKETAPKKKFRRTKKSEQKTLISKRKKDIIEPTLQDSKEITQKNFIKDTDRSLFDYIEGETDQPKVQTKLESYFKPKEINKEQEANKIKSFLNAELLCEELVEINSKLENMAEKYLTLPKYETASGFIQDEDRNLESYYCCLVSLQNQFKSYLNNVTSFSLALYGKYDPGFINIVRRGMTIFNDVEKDLHRVAKFNSVKESTLKSCGSIGIDCLKGLAQIEQSIIKLLQLEGSSLYFILAVTESGYALSEEHLIKENLSHILKVYKNISQFLKHMDCFKNASKAFKTFIHENLYLYFLCSIYIRKNSTLFQFPLIEELCAVLLSFNEDRIKILEDIEKELIEKTQYILKSACITNPDLGTSRSSNTESFFSVTKKNNIKSSDSVLVLLKKKNYQEEKDSPYYDYLIVQFLKYFLKLEFSLQDLISDPSFLGGIIKSRFPEFQLLISSHIILFRHRLNQYFIRPVPDMRINLLDFIHESVNTIFLCSTNEVDFNHSLECLIHLAKKLPLRWNYFMRIQEAVSRFLKPESQKNSFLRLKSVPIENACQYDYTSIKFYENLSQELETKGVSHTLRSMGTNRHMLLGLILELCYHNEKSKDENEQNKINRRIISRSLSTIHNHNTLNEEALKDPNRLKLFLSDFCLVLSIINLSKNNPELLMSTYLKIKNFINISESHRVIKSLVLSLQIDLINYCIQFKELEDSVKDIFKTTLNVLSSLLSEFLEISRIQNHLNKMDNSKGDENDVKLQKLIQQIMLKLRNAITSNIEFVLENKVDLLPNGLSFLKILNPSNPVTAGLRKEILDYIELILMSKDKIHDLIRTNKGLPIPSPSPSLSSQMQQEDDFDFVDDVLERENKNIIIMNNLVAWRQIALEKGKDMLTLLHELIMSVYNKEIMTTIHHRYHVDIFLVEKSLDLYAICAKLLMLEGKITFEEIEKKFGFNSVFYSSKGTNNKFVYQSEDRMKGALLKRNHKLSLLLRFFCKFLSFEKGENDKLMRNGYLKGLENFIVDSHLVLFLASIESLSDISIIQKDYYHFMAEFAMLMAGAQETNGEANGLNDFLINAYIERGFQNTDETRDQIEILKKIFYNLQVALSEIDEKQKFTVLKFVENILTKFVKYLRQDLIEENQTSNNGKFFGLIYKNICGLVPAIGSIFPTKSCKSLTDLLSLLLIDNFGKMNFDLVDDSVMSYNPLIFNNLMNENILFDFKSFIEAVFSMPKEKEKHFARKVFVKLLYYLLKKDIETVKAVKLDPENAKLKKWEVLFRLDTDMILYGETFFKNLFYICDRRGHNETFLNCFRALFNMSNNGDFTIAIHLLRSIYPVIKEVDMGKWGEKFIELFSVIMSMLDKTTYSEEERISLLYIVTYLYKKIPNKYSNDKMIGGISLINEVCLKWILQIISLIDYKIIEKLQINGYEIPDFELDVEESMNENKEVNDMEVKIFEMSLKIYHENERQNLPSKYLGREIKELIQEKMKINLALGELYISGETKKILQILTEY